MLVDFEYIHKYKKLIISYIDKSGNIKLKYYNWKAHNYEIANDNDKNITKYKTWDNKKIKLVPTKYPNKHSILDFINDLPEDEQNIIFEYCEPNIFFIDIETEITTEKPQPHIAKNKVLTISIVFNDNIIVLGFDPLNKEDEQNIINDINNNYGSKFEKKWKFKYITYKNEYELLKNFFYVFVPKMTILTGWNFIYFDWVYLINRAKNLNIDISIISPTKSLYYGYIPNTNHKFEMPKHKLIIDYMEIFDMWDTSIKIKESLSLDFISEKTLNVKKVNYEGNLKTLYEKNFKKFVYYNAVDTILVQLIHDTTKILNIMFTISILSKIPINKATSTIYVTEGILRKKIKDKKNILLINKDDTENYTIQGAWVKNPQGGIRNYVACYDFSSLYPTTIRQFNISIDSFKGIYNKEKNIIEFENDKYKVNDDDIILCNNCVFKNEIGIVNETLTEIFEKRKIYKKKKIETYQKLNKLKNELKKIKGEL